MRFTMPRESYIPAGAVESADTESDAIAFTYETAGALCALAFHGKAAKPDWHYRFKTEEQRASKISEHFASRRAHAAFRAESKTKAAAAITLKVGDILVASWGYDQTNVDWYQVTAIVGARMIELREIGANSVTTASMQGTATPRKDHFIGEALRRMVAYGNHVKVDRSRHASPWDGQPEHWSSYA